MLLIVLFGCSTAPPARCDYADFSVGSSHMTNAITRPFVVRELKGRFVPLNDDGDPGEWIGEENRIRLQINGPAGMELHVPVQPDGTFDVPGLPDGKYCFHSASEGLQGYDGIIIVSSRAPAGAVVRIHVALAV